MTEATRSGYRRSHCDPQKGAQYDRKFVDTPHRALMWQLEQRVLDSVVTRHLPEGNSTHLDFACGTGRVLAHLAPRMAKSVGVDISESMLAVARQRVPSGLLVEGDITRSPTLIQDRFDLITAFRFFPNAEPALRSEAIHALVSRLAPQGVLVFNNHLNSSSAFVRVARLFPKYRHLGMSMRAVDELVREGGLEVVERHHIGVLPSNDRYMLLPGRMVRRIEEAASTATWLWRIAQNVITICRHAQ